LLRQPAPAGRSDRRAAGVGGEGAGADGTGRQAAAAVAPGRLHGPVPTPAERHRGHGAIPRAAAKAGLTGGAGAVPRPQDYVELVEWLRRWAAQAGLLVDQVELSLRGKTVILLPIPPGMPSAEAPAPEGRGPGLPQVVLDVLTVLQEAGKPLPRTL